jgi:multidrug efflux system outer membrane protein
VKRSVAIVGTGLLFWASAVRAQSPTAASTAPGGSEAVPPAPQIDDPMLVPVPLAPRLLSSWNEALSMLLARSLDLRNAYDQVKIAVAQSRIALAATLPNLNGLGSATHQFITHTSSAESVTLTSSAAGTTAGLGTTVPTPNYLNGSLVLTQPLLAIEAWHAIGTAHVSEEASRLSAEDLKRTLSIGVGTAIVNVVAAERVAELNRVGLRNALEQLALTRLKAKDGAANALDVERMQQSVDAARATLVTGDESLREAREALGLALGLPEAIGVSQGMSLNDLVTSAMGSCRTTFDLRERKDIAALRKLEEVADRNVTDVYEQFLPTIGASSVLATTTLDTGVAPATTWNIQAVLTVPIWDGGVRYGNLHSNQALLDEARNSLEAAERNGTIAVLQAKRNVDVSAAAERVADQARTTDANIDRMTRGMYRVGGEVTSLDLLLAAENLREAEINLALKQAATVQAKLAAALTLSICRW